MADDIFINGLGPGVPEWSNEATQKQVLNALNSGLSQNTAANKQILSMLKRIANGEGVQQGQLRGAINELKKLEKTQKQNITQQKQSNDIERKQLGVFGQFVQLTQQSLQIQRSQLDVAKRSQELQKEGFSEGFANIAANLEKQKENAGFIREMLTKVGAAASAVAASINMASNATVTAGRDRFSFAQELRQSGLTAGLDTASSSLVALAKSTANANFTMGEAAEFTRNFSQAVGVRGVQASLEFANNLAKSDGGDLMNRFGLQFGEVTDLAGTYLESLRNIGALDKISRQDMDRGMENFMSTVVSTSNVMKINMQEAAELIKDTLQRDDISSLLATLPDAMRQNAEAVVGMAGGMDSSLGEALAMRLSAGSSQAFVQTDQYAALLADPITANLLPLVEQLASATETGGTGAFQRTLADLGPQLQGIVDSANRTLLLTGSGDAQRTIADVIRLLQTTGDADAGRAPLPTDDRVIIENMEIERRRAVVVEQLGTLFTESVNLTETIGSLNAANAKLTEGILDMGLVTVTPLSDAASKLIKDQAIIIAKGGEILSFTANAIGDPAAMAKSFGVEPLVEEMKKLTEAIEKTNSIYNSQTGADNELLTGGFLPNYNDDFSMLDKVALGGTQGVLQGIDALTNVTGNFIDFLTGRDDFGKADLSTAFEEWVNTPAGRKFLTFGRGGNDDPINNVPNISNMSPAELEQMARGNMGGENTNNILNNILKELTEDRKDARGRSKKDERAEIDRVINSINELIKTLDR